MVRFAQLVIGPAGSGKSTYCGELQKYCEETRRTVHVVNLDPAAEHFDYNISIDIRELISIDDVAEELKLGPNGGLVYCLEYLLDNEEWLLEQLEGFVDGDYLCIDCPGQIELYTHFDIMRKVVQVLENNDFRMCALYFLDSQFLSDTSKFFGGSMSALSAMAQLNITHINIMSKMDLIDAGNRSKLDAFVYPDYDQLIADLNRSSNPKLYGLNKAIGSLMEEYNMISFVPLDYDDEDSVAHILLQVDLSLNYDEVVEPRVPSDEEPEDEPDDDE